MKFELRSIDAWHVLGEGWNWNTSFLVEDDIDLEPDVSDSALLDFMIHNKWLTETARETVAIDDSSWPLIEFQNSTTGEPLLALLGREI